MKFVTLISFVLVAMVVQMNAMEKEKRLSGNSNDFIQLSPRLKKSNNAQNKAKLLPQNQKNSNPGKSLLDQQKK